MRDSTFPAVNPSATEAVDIGTRRRRRSVTSRLSGSETVIPFSIAELVGVQLGDNEAPWHLSLVQRNAVWSELQTAYLLDSMLCGYPIGSLLLCTVERDGSVLVKHERGGHRDRMEAPEGVYQLLDGQQRMNALESLFAQKDGRQRGYLLSLVKDRNLKDLTKRRKSVQRSLEYIRLLGDERELEQRWQWLDVSKLYAAASRLSYPEPTQNNNDGSELWLEVAAQIDDECALDEWKKLARRHPERVAPAARRIQALLRAWNAKSIPVVKLGLGDPTDVLQVFNRVNRAGTPVSNDDIFFAAVRTLWVEAEKHVVRVSECASPGKRGSQPALLPPMDALRLLTRMASVRIEQGDVIPLDIERLRGESGRSEQGQSKLIQEMQALSQTGSEFLNRIRMLALLASRRSKLGYALHLIPKRLWDPVFAWAATHKTGELDDAALLPAWEFLVGATAFRYLSVFGPAFERICMAKAVEAGTDGEPFPLADIISECRAKWPGLRRGQRAVVSLDGDAAKRDLVNDNAALFLHFVQGSSFHLPEGKSFDVEHIYPQSRVDYMKWKGRNDKEHIRRRHEDARDVFRVGNLCMLDSNVNRSVGKKWPDEKLTEGYPDAGIQSKDLFLSKNDIAALEQTSFCLRDQKGKQCERVPEAMEVFSAYVKSRERRIFKRMARRFPGALGFAADARQDSKSR